MVLICHLDLNQDNCICLISRTPLHLACINGHADVVQFLVEKKCKLNPCDKLKKSPLMKVCRRGICSLIFDGIHTFQFWEGAGVLSVRNIDVGRYSSFVSCFQAVEHQHRDCAAILLEHGANHDHRGVNGNTALHLAVRVSSKPLVELLLEYGADIDAKNKVSLNFG